MGAFECDDQNPCTVDQCRSGIRTHDPVADPIGCSPVVPSYQHALELRAGVERLLVYMNDEIQVGGNASGRLDDDLAAERACAIVVHLSTAALVMLSVTRKAMWPLFAAIGWHVLTRRGRSR
jgi:hypothetical protein